MLSFVDAIAQPGIAQLCPWLAQGMESALRIHPIHDYSELNDTVRATMREFVSGRPQLHVCTVYSQPERDYFLVAWSMTSKHLATLEALPAAAAAASGIGASNVAAARERAIAAARQLHLAAAAAAPAPQ